MTPAVQSILIVTIAGFMLQSVDGVQMITSFALWPLTGPFMPWQLLSYAFLHGSLMHIVFNMYGLWMFGRELEALLGRRVFYQLYFASVLAAGLMQLLVTTMTGGMYPTVGASGGLFGLLLAYAMFFPNRVIMLILPPVAMRARTFVFVYAAIELYLGVTGTQAGVAHFAHLGGMIGAYLVLRNRDQGRWK
ncbi:MAG: rhomboid family intramembrane serine protease [Pseudomonadota bacterium]